MDICETQPQAKTLVGAFSLAAIMLEILDFGQLLTGTEELLSRWQSPGGRDPGIVGGLNLCLPGMRVPKKTERPTPPRASQFRIRTTWCQECHNRNISQRPPGSVTRSRSLIYADSLHSSLPILHNDKMVTYDLAQYSWNDTQSVTVVSSTAEVIAVFPLSFLLTGGCGNWSYVLETIGVLVQTEGNEGVGALIDGTGASISAPDQKLQAGVYQYDSKHIPIAH
jgi:hypothetical protein